MCSSYSGGIMKNRDHKDSPKIGDLTYTSSRLTKSLSFFITPDSKEKHFFLKNIGEGSFAKARLYTGGLVIKEISDILGTAKDCKNEAIISYSFFGKGGFLPGSPVHRISMPYIAGIPLGLVFAELAKDFNKNPHNSLKLMRGIFEAYYILHQKNIFHNDYHFGNLLVDKNGKIWIIDFGNSVLLDNPELRSLSIEKETKSIGKNTIHMEFLKYLDSDTQNTLNKIKLSLGKDKALKDAIGEIDDLLDKLGCSDHSTNFLSDIVKEMPVMQQILKDEERSQEMHLKMQPKDSSSCSIM